MKIPRGWSSLLPPSSHCQKRTHLGFRGDTALRGQWRMPRRLFCRRFYFVSVKERKVKQSQSGRLATPGGFFCQAVETLGDRGPKQAIRGEKGGAGGANSPPPIIAANQKFLSGQDEPQADLSKLRLLQVESLPSQRKNAGR